MGDENTICTLRDYSKPSHKGYRNTIELPIRNNMVPLRSDTIWLVQNGCSFHGLRFEDPNQHLKDFLKLVDSLNLNGENKERMRLLNKVTTLCEICGGPHNTQYCMEDPKQAFVEYASSRTDETGGLVSNFMASQDARLSKFQADFKQQQSKMTKKIGIVLKAITDRIAGALPSDTVKNPKLKKENEKEEKDCPENIHINPSTLLDPSVAFITEKVLKFNSFFESLGLVPQSSDTEVICTKGDDEEVMFIELIRKNDDFSKGEPEEEGSITTKGVGAEYFDIFPTRSELAYHKYLMCSPIPLIFLRNPIITEGCPSTLKIPCSIRHVHVETAYIDLNSPLNIMTRMMYNWIIRRKLDPRENSNKGVSNFTGRIKGMHVFVGKFTYIIDFMIVDDISSIINPRTDEVAYKMPHMIEQYNSLSDLEKEHTKSVNLRNKEDKRRGVEYVMSKILGFYKECLKLGPEYVTRMDDEGELT
ncbi:hypothetical protein Tco_0791462 [Tanacetum coccineum]